MKKIIGILTGLMFCAVLFAQKTINDPNAEVRNVSSFNAIRISNAFDVYITQGNQEALAISASKQEYKDRIETKVENGTLVIRFNDDKKFWKGIGGDRTKLKAYISVKNLDKMHVSGACDVFFEDGLSAETFSIELSGASDVKGKLNVKKLIVDINGASDMTISGNATDVTIESSGASDFKGFDFVTNYCSAKASGASSVSITVNKELNAVANGASSVKFKGDGLIRDIKTSGASSVTRKS